MMSCRLCPAVLIKKEGRERRTRRCFTFNKAGESAADLMASSSEHTRVLSVPSKVNTKLPDHRSDCNVVAGLRGAAFLRG